MMCACGRPLHYRREQDEAAMRETVAQWGEHALIITPRGRWLVPRHYLALHGLRCGELPTIAGELGFERAA